MAGSCSSSAPLTLRLLVYVVVAFWFGTVSVTMKVTCWPSAIVALPPLAASKAASRLPELSPIALTVTGSVLAELVLVTV